MASHSGISEFVFCFLFFRFCPGAVGIGGGPSLEIETQQRLLLERNSEVHVYAYLSVYLLLHQCSKSLD